MVGGGGGCLVEGAAYLAAFFVAVAIVEAGPIHRAEWQKRNINTDSNSTSQNYPGGGKLYYGECITDQGVYHAGESVPSPGPCESCTCRPPKVFCSMMPCPINPGCRTIQRSNQCCPDYRCECEYNGQTYNNGEKIKIPEQPCQVCYCKGGEVMCTSITCYQRDDCEPNFIPGQCCPKYDHCPPLDTTNGNQKEKTGNSVKISRSSNTGFKREMQPWLLTQPAQKEHETITTNSSPNYQNEQTYTSQLIHDLLTTHEERNKKIPNDDLTTNKQQNTVVFTKTSDRLTTLQEDKKYNTNPTTLQPAEIITRIHSDKSEGTNSSKLDPLRSTTSYTEHTSTILPESTTNNDEEQTDDINESTLIEFTAGDMLNDVSTLYNIVAQDSPNLLSTIRLPDLSKKDEINEEMPQKVTFSVNTRSNNDNIEKHFVFSDISTTDFPTTVITTHDNTITTTEQSVTREHNSDNEILSRISVEYDEQKKSLEMSQTTLKAESDAENDEHYTTNSDNEVFKRMTMPYLSTYTMDEESEITEKENMSSTKSNTNPETVSTESIINNDMTTRQPDNNLEEAAIKDLLTEDFVNSGGKKNTLSSMIETTNNEEDYEIHTTIVTERNNEKLETKKSSTENYFNGEDYLDIKSSDDKSEKINKDVTETKFGTIASILIPSKDIESLKSDSSINEDGRVSYFQENQQNDKLKSYDKKKMRPENSNEEKEIKKDENSGSEGDSSTENNEKELSDEDTSEKSKNSGTTQKCDTKNKPENIKKQSTKEEKINKDKTITKHKINDDDDDDDNDESKEETENSESEENNKESKRRNNSQSSTSEETDEEEADADKKNKKSDENSNEVKKKDKKNSKNNPETENESKENDESENNESKENEESESNENNESKENDKNNTNESSSSSESNDVKTKKNTDSSDSSSSSESSDSQTKENSDSNSSSSSSSESSDSKKKEKSDSSSSSSSSSDSSDSKTKEESDSSSSSSSSSESNNSKKKEKSDSSSSSSSSSDSSDSKTKEESDSSDSSSSSESSDSKTKDKSDSSSSSSSSSDSSDSKTKEESDSSDSSSSSESSDSKKKEKSDSSSSSSSSSDSSDSKTKEESDSSSSSSSSSESNNSKKKEKSDSSSSSSSSSDSSDSKTKEESDSSSSSSSSSESSNSKKKEKSDSSESSSSSDSSNLKSKEDSDSSSSSSSEDSTESENDNAEVVNHTDKKNESDGKKINIVNKKTDLNKVKEKYENSLTENNNNLNSGTYKSDPEKNSEIKQTITTHATSTSENEGTTETPPVLNINDDIPIIKIRNQNSGSSNNEAGTIQLDLFNIKGDDEDSKKSLGKGSIKLNTTPAIKVTVQNKNKLNFTNTHILLTPADLKILAEYLINEKIKPISHSRNNDTHLPPEWLKHNLTTPGVKINSLLSTGNINIGVVNFNHKKKPTSVDNNNHNLENTESYSTEYTSTESADEVEESRTTLKNTETTIPDVETFEPIKVNREENKVKIEKLSEDESKISFNIIKPSKMVDDCGDLPTETLNTFTTESNDDNTHFTQKDNPTGITFDTTTDDILQETDDPCIEEGEEDETVFSTIKEEQQNNEIMANKLITTLSPDNWITIITEITTPNSLEEEFTEHFETEVTVRPKRNNDKDNDVNCNDSDTINTEEVNKQQNGTKTTTTDHNVKAKDLHVKTSSPLMRKSDERSDNTNTKREFDRDADEYSSRKVKIPEMESIVKESFSTTLDDKDLLILQEFLKKHMVIQ